MSVTVETTTRRIPGGSAVWLVGAGIVVAVLLPISVVVGTIDISLQQAIDAYRSFDPSVTEQLLVREIRVPRTIIAVIVGAALGASGVIMQALTRNPLAEPGLLGVNAGATLAVAFGISILNLSSVTASLLCGFAGAALAGVGVYLLGGVHKGAGPVRLVLAGAALSVVMLAATRIIIVNSDTQAFDRFRSWTVGSFEGRGNDLLIPTAIAVGCGFVLALLIATSLDASALGHDLSRSLGAHPGRVLSLSAVAIVLMCGAATAAAGPISFVGLTAPHIARHLVGLDHRRLIPASALIAAAVVLIADVAGRLLVSSGEISVGIMIGFIGAPFFISIVRRRKLAQL